MTCLCIFTCQVIFFSFFFTCALFQSASLSRCSSLTLSSPYTCCCLFPASCNALFAHTLTQPLSHSPAFSSPWLHFKLFTLANVTRCVRKFFYLCSVQTCVLFARQFVVASRERQRRACLHRVVKVLQLDFNCSLCCVCSNKKKHRGCELALNSTNSVRMLITTTKETSSRREGVGERERACTI